MVDQIAKLTHIREYLKNSSRFNFQNYDIKIFVNFLKKDHFFNSLLFELEQKYPAEYESAKTLAEHGFVTIHKEGTPQKSSSSIAQNPAAYRLEHINTMDEWVSFCWQYINYLPKNSGDKAIDNFIVRTGTKDDNLKPKEQFFNECIEPILIYLEMRLNSTHSKISSMKRYKVYCEWFELDRKKNKNKLYEKSETELTEDHLSKFLFQEGFTYSLVETNIQKTKGRIDNFALKVIEDKINIDEIIIAEGKIIKKTNSKKDLLECRNQINDRLEKLNLQTGFCVLYSKLEETLILKRDSIESIPSFGFIEHNDNKTIYYLIINLDSSFIYGSKNRKDKEFTFDQEQ